MTEPVLITPKGLKATQWRTTAHLNMGSVHALNKEAIDYPGLRISISTDKRAKTSTRFFFILGDDREFATIGEAAKAWNDLARARASQAA
jgi:hypothetical protein